MIGTDDVCEWWLVSGPLLELQALQEIVVYDTDTTGQMHEDSLH